MESLTIKTDAFSMTDEEFFRFCLANRSLRIECDADKNIIIMSPNGYQTGKINGELFFQLKTWCNKNNSGILFESSVGFTLPSGAVRSPDVAFVSIEKDLAVTTSERQRFPNICPEFLIELKSPSDSLKVLKLKMMEWIDNGCCLAWLIDAGERKIYIYRKGGSVEIKSFTDPITGEDVLPGFILDVHIIEEILEKH